MRATINLFFQSLIFKRYAQETQRRRNVPLSSIAANATLICGRGNERVFHSRGKANFGLFEEEFFAFVEDLVVGQFESWHGEGRG